MPPDQEGTNDAAQLPIDTATPAPADTPSPPLVDDVDQIELREAHAAAKAEEAGKGATEGDAATGTAQPTPTDAAATPEKVTPMIPKPRFDEVLGEREKLAQENAYLRGRLDGAAPAPGAPQPSPQPQVVTPQQHIAAIKLEKQAIAKRFDNGEISRSEEMALVDALDDQIHAIREEALVGKVGNRSTESVSEDFGLQSETARLEEAHPWVGVLEALKADGNADWSYLRGQAQANVIARGIDPATKFGTYQLRKEIAELADQYGPTLFAARAQAKGIPLPGAAPAAAAATSPPLSPAAQARQAKLGVMSNAPPNVPAMSGITGANGGQPTDAQIESMTEEEIISKMPRAARQKFLGLT